MRKIDEAYIRLNSPEVEIDKTDWMDDMILAMCVLLLTGWIALIAWGLDRYCYKFL